MTTSGGTRTSSSDWSWRSSLGRVAGRLMGGLGALCFPPECVVCGAQLREPGLVCERCGEAFAPLEGDRCILCGAPVEGPSLDLCTACGTRERGFDRVLALGPYEGGWGALVRALKFDRERLVARWLSKRLAEHARREGIRADVVTFVPMTADERRGRGFNQSRVLARGVAARLGVPMRRTLRKTRRTASQAGLSARSRRENLRGAFSALPSRGGRVLLVDDICTTGSTAEACARALRRAGVHSVDVLVVARA
jgi:ComF family protein